MNNRFQNSSLGQQLAYVAGGLCLLVSLALVALGAISSKHMQQQQQREYGEALARQLAHRAGNALETGNLLAVTASLQRFVETSTVEQVAIFDVEGKALGQAGKTNGQRLQKFRAPVRIEQDIAGEALVVLNNDQAHAAHLRFVFSLLGLAVILSLAVFGAGLHLGQKLGRQVTGLARRIALEDSVQETPPANEVSLLSQRVEALPMDLLRTRSDTQPDEENYRTTAVLYAHLDSLTDYVDTLDENSLHRYTDRLHQVVYAAAGFYGGEIQVSRQFGLAVYFSGATKAGSPAFRAACCGWLVQAVAREMEKQMPLSMTMALAISQSELGIGDGRDIYPGLYMQHTLDELQAVCSSKPPKILLSPAASADTDVEGRLQLQDTEVRDYAMLESFAGPYQDLLERQLRLILRKIMDPTL